MNSPRKSKKRKKGQGPELPHSMSVKDKVQMWTWIVGLLGVSGVVAHCSFTWEQRIKFDQEINQWRQTYHLTDEQCQSIRSIEETFHGSGDPFTCPIHEPAETRQHHRAIAAKMNAEDGERFFQAQERPIEPR